MRTFQPRVPNRKDPKETIAHNGSFVVVSVKLDMKNCTTGTKDCNHSGRVISPYSRVTQSQMAKARNVAVCDAFVIKIAGNGTNTGLSASEVDHVHATHRAFIGSMEVGIIGMGDMGKMYARKISTAGYKVNACDIPSKYSQLCTEFKGNPLST